MTSNINKSLKSIEEDINCMQIDNREDTDYIQSDINQDTTCYKPDSFVFYKSFYDAISLLPEKQQLGAFKAIFEFAFYNNEIILTNTQSAILSLIKPQIKANIQKRENGKKGAEYGKLGGRPALQKTPVGLENKTPKGLKNKPFEGLFEINPSGVITETPNVNVTANVNDNVNVINILPGAENAPDEQPVITLTLNNNDEYPIYEKQIAVWTELYPVVNIMQELRNMKGWVMSNPTKRKTQSGILKFINTWLSKAQDQGGSSGIKNIEMQNKPTFAHPNTKKFVGSSDISEYANKYQSEYQVPEYKNRRTNSG